jgi:hypothetical protein
VAMNLRWRRLSARMTVLLSFSGAIHRN